MTAADPNSQTPPPTSRLKPVGFLLVLTGPSGAGKGTLVDRLLHERSDTIFGISSTTRPKRETETEARQYRFVTKAEFEVQRERGYFLEWAEVHGHLYGTPVEEVETQMRQGRVVVLDVDVQGGASIRSKRDDAVSVFVAPPSLDSLRQRLSRRATDAAEVIETRMGNAPEELAQYVHYDYLIVNDNLEQAFAALLAIHDAERLRVARLIHEV